MKRWLPWIDDYVYTCSDYNSDMQYWEKIFIIFTDRIDVCLMNYITHNLWKTKTLNLVTLTYSVDESVDT